MMKYTQSNLDKLQGILGDADYVIRFERGTFQSGWCLLEQKRVVVLNKFLNVEGRINTLLEIIPQLNIEFDKLTHESQKLYETVLKRAAQAESAAEEAAIAEAAAAEAAKITAEEAPATENEQPAEGEQVQQTPSETE